MTSHRLRNSKRVNNSIVNSINQLIVKQPMLLLLFTADNQHTSNDTASSNSKMPLIYAKTNASFKTPLARVSEWPAWLTLPLTWQMSDLIPVRINPSLLISTVISRFIDLQRTQDQITWEQTFHRKHLPGKHRNKNLNNCKKNTRQNHSQQRNISVSSYFFLHMTIQK